MRLVDPTCDDDETKVPRRWCEYKYADTWLTLDSQEYDLLQAAVQLVKPHVKGASVEIGVLARMYETVNTMGQDVLLEGYGGKCSPPLLNPTPTACSLWPRRASPMPTACSHARMRARARASVCVRTLTTLTRMYQHGGKEKEGVWSPGQVFGGIGARASQTSVGPRRGTRTTGRGEWCGALLCISRDTHRRAHTPRTDARTPTIGQVLQGTEKSGAAPHGRIFRSFCIRDPSCDGKHGGGWRVQCYRVMVRDVSFLCSGL